jgi:hypothetical protein
MHNRRYVIYLLRRLRFKQAISGADPPCMENGA